jgi:hypothetical protein
MELNEAALRIVVRHWVLIVAFVLMGVLAALLRDQGEVPLYTASARVVLDTQDPRSTAEAAANADAARGIVTGQELVAMALRRERVNRDPAEVVKAIGLTALGSSGVLELSVRDPDPAVAAAVVNALARELIDSRSAFSRGRVSQAVSELGAQVDDLIHRTAALDQRLGGLQEELLTAGEQQRAGLRRQLNEATQERDYLQQRKGAAQSQLDALVAEDALRPQASVIDSAMPPAKPDPSRRAADAALGATLGLVVGLGAAATVEAVHPTIVGSDAIGRALSAPVLEDAPGWPDDLTDAQLRELARLLNLSAHNFGVNLVELVGCDPSLDLAPVAARITGAELGDRRVKLARGAKRAGAAAPPRSDLDVPAEDVSSPRSAIIRPFRASSPSAPGARASGLVFVVPRAIKRRDLNRLTRVQRILGWPLIGVITYRPHALARRLARQVRLGWSRSEEAA